MARSNLFKTALFGNDPNWGRVLAAVGTTEPPSSRTRWTWRSTACGSAAAAPPARTGRQVDLTGREVTVRSTCTPARRPRPIWTNDLTHGVRPRELGVLHVSTRTQRTIARSRPGQGGHADRGAALDRAVPGSTVVVKYGGNAMIDDELQRAFAADMVFLRYAGFKPVVVHGGGPQISAMLGRLGIASEFRGGLRVTTAEAMDVVRMVLVGQVGRELVGLINSHGPYAVGLSGEDAGLFTAVRRPRVVDGEPVDVARSGTSSRVDVGRGHRPDRGRSDPGDLHGGAGRGRRAAQRQRGHRRRGAGHRAAGPQAGRPHRREGLYADWPDTTAWSPRSTADELAKLLPGLESGMVPKMEACLRAVRGGVPGAHVVDGRVAHSMLLEVFTSEGFGTMVVPDDGTDAT